jgi:hypothetical protein
MLAMSQQIFAGKKLRVLFIGNSYTYVNNLPQIAADISASMGDTLLFDSYTLGGYTLFQHLLDVQCTQKIQSAPWDYIVLQEQSLAPALSDQSFFVDSYSGAKGLDNIIKANDSCSKVIFYMTWGYKNGFSPYCSDPVWPYPCTYEGMDSLINLRYRAYADSSVLATMGYSDSTISGFQPVRPALISPAGAVWHYIRDHHPGIELYQADDSHPTPAGSYAAACAFYVTLFRKDPTLIPYNYVLSSTDAGNIKNAARLVTYDSMSKWHIDTDLRARFTFTAGIGNAVSFINTSTSASSYLWDFGDGNTSQLPNPIHTYTNSGQYMTKLIAFNSSCSDTTFAVTNTSATGIENVNITNADFIISPNPARDIVNIHPTKKSTGPCQLSITNTLGHEVYFRESISAGQQIDISRFSSGMYFIIIKTNNKLVGKYKLLKL